jgi:TetR/AcrR family transcriptional repressor of bet genes
MRPRKKTHKDASGAPRARKTRSRQRQRLIDACISALHIYGPSRTTVEKVVAIAKMSPGIVRFYFDSKAAMLVASLQFLAAEFEERLLVPVKKLKSTPIAALERMVDLYLDPDIASPRKVSVWYAFWGEASSRQEYYDICGQKDESFAALVRELIESLIIETAQPQLDPDGIALGLIGALEILWQDFAFRTERNIDRAAAKGRCMAYLRSVFPSAFPAPDGLAAARAARPAARGRLAGWAYADARIHALERELLFKNAWSVVGHESQIARAGEFLCIDSGAERLLVVRDATGAVHALRNSCPESPHALLSSRSGRLEADIECKRHGLHFSWDGRCTTGSGRTDLSILDLAPVGGLLFARPAARDRSLDEPAPETWFDAPPPQGLTMLGPAIELTVAADWKVVVEQWLESCAGDAVPEGTHDRAAPFAPSAAAEGAVWHSAAAGGPAWSARRYRKLMERSPAGAWRRQFIAPNQLLETRPDGLAVVQAIPVAPGRCLVRRLDYTALAPGALAVAALYLARRLAPYARRTTLEAAESIQEGTVEFGYQVAPGAPAAAAVAWFRNQLAARIPALARQRAPTDN